jgi:hypothetical protein
MNNPMDSLYARLAKTGMTKMFARRLLPDWWDDTLGMMPSALLQAQLIISTGMNFELRSVRDPAADIEFASARRKFKLNKSVDSASIRLSAEYATGMAKLAAQAMHAQYIPPPPDALGIRNALLSTHRCVDLPALLEYCNRAGIPVLHITDLPGKKMDAVAIRQHGRSAIVLCKNTSASYLLFHLAHEIGHIALGHLGNVDGTLVDVKINSADSDADEMAADAFAVQLLNGLDSRYSTGARFMSGKHLAVAAISYGTQHRIDPGHITLNYAHVANNFRMANVALKLLPNVADAKIVNRNLLDQINLNSLSDDQATMLTKAIAS